MFIKKNRAMSRHSRQRRGVPKATIFNVMTLQRSEISFFFSTSRRYREETQLFEKKISKIKSTHFFRFCSLSNPDFDYPSYLSAAASISEPENITPCISYGLRENVHL